MKKYVLSLLILALLLAGCGGRKSDMPPEILLPPETQAEEQTRPAMGEIPITMENWEVYFELRPVAPVENGQEGSLGLAVVLKEEYLPLYRESRVDFEIGYQEVTCRVENGAYIPEETQEEPRDRAKTVGLQDFPAEEAEPELQGMAAAYVLGGSTYTLEDGSSWAVLAVNGQVLHAEGTLILS